MAYSYKIRKHAGLVLISAWDVLNSQEVLEFRTRIRQEPNFNPDLYQLLDFSRVKGIDIDTLTIMGLARDHVFSGESRRAFIAVTPLCIGLVHQFIAFREIWGGAEEIEIFSTQEKALEWLFYLQQMRIKPASSSPPSP